MKIKNISIIGFKSFMDRLQIEFPMGISAVVGPNGCGKSNIVDAIRWAMGEQSAKLLRGRNMEDVIFNGAGESKPLGMAEVSITFENGDGSFPTEFAHETEICVTRRLYRSGESEYLINRVPCRLKDIQEIFMDTGLGNRAYSIIGQGMIGAIIDQKPEETRFMLEEASGITKYRRKVDESRRKVELTKANLQRVEDIMLEVERQMRSLKRQAAKARRYKRIGREIQRLELILHANSYHNLQEESGNRVKSAEGLVQEEIAKSTEFSRLQADVSTLNLELEEKDAGIARLRSAYLQGKENVNRKESLLESLEGEKRMQMELESRLTDEKEETKKRLGRLHEEREDLSAKADALRESFSSKEQEIELLNERLRRRKQLLREAKEEFERARTKVSSGQTKEMGLNQESGYLNQRITEITDGTKRLEDERSEVLAKSEQVAGASRRKTDTREALASKLDDINREITAENEKLDELNQTGKSLELELKTAEAEFNSHDTRLTSLRSLIDNYEGFQVGVRTIMKSTDLEPMRDGRIMGLVADVIRVDPQYELAVETVLADRLQYIVVEKIEDGKEAIDYLKSREKGRGSFVPLKDLRADEMGDSSGNGLPLLRSLVAVSDDSYKPLIHALLGDTALVDDLAQAISAWQSNGKHQCLVTPEGDMIDARGILSGGKQTHKSQAILSRKREIRELESKVKQSRQKTENLRKRQEDTNRAIQNKEEHLNALIREKTEAQDKINDLDRVILRLSHELDQLERLSARINDELREKSREQEKHRQALTKIQQELIRCKEKVKQEELYLREKERELNESEEEFEHYRNELDNLRMGYNLSREEEKGLLQQIERIDEFSRDAREKLKRIDQDVLNGKKKYQDCMKREQEVRETLKTLYEDLSKAESAVNEAEHERSDFVNRIKEEERKGESLREEIEILKEKINTAKLEQSEIRFKMNNLLEVIRDKYNMDLKDIYGDYLEEEFSPVETKEKIEHQKALRERLGEVNLAAIQEHEALKERHSFISEQREDLLNSIESLNKAIQKINRVSLEKFMKTFKDVDAKLKEVFPILFNGGTAGLRLIDETRPLESGVLVEVKPPGKKLSHMGLLSGGEKALVAMALLFAIYLIKPSPFCLLDEVDAPLDEANIDRFNDLLQEIKKHSQIVLVTHNRRSMEIVDRLYGVTMEKAGISKIVSVNLQGISPN